MRKNIMIGLSLVLMLVHLPFTNAQINSDDEGRRPFIPGREQNLF